MVLKLASPPGGSRIFTIFHVVVAITEQNTSQVNDCILIKMLFGPPPIEKMNESTFQFKFLHVETS